MRVFHTSTMHLIYFLRDACHPSIHRNPSEEYIHETGVYFCIYIGGRVRDPYACLLVGPHIYLSVASD